MLGKYTSLIFPSSTAQTQVLMRSEQLSHVPWTITQNKYLFVSAARIIFFLLPAVIHPIVGISLRQRDSPSFHRESSSCLSSVSCLAWWHPAYYILPIRLHSNQDVAGLLPGLWPKLFCRTRSFLSCRLLENTSDSVHSVHSAALRRNALNVRWQSVCRCVRKVGTKFCSNSLWQERSLMATWQLPLIKMAAVWG